MLKKFKYLGYRLRSYKLMFAIFGIDVITSVYDSELAKKLSTALFAIRKTEKLTNHEATEAAYFAYFRSLLSSRREAEFLMERRLDLMLLG